MKPIKTIANKYKRFVKRNPDGIGKADIDFKGLTYVGTVIMLEYYSDKTIPNDNPKKPVGRRHFHPFEKPHYVFTNAKKDTLFIAPTKISGRGILD